MPRRSRLLAALLLCGCSFASQADNFYSVGNSLTLDCCGNGAIAAFDGALGNTLVQDSHVRFGAALDSIVSQPQAVDVGTSWQVALPAQAWNFVAMEPYPSATSTLASDIQSVQTLLVAATIADPAQPPEVLLFAAWPSRTSFQGLGGFSEYWNQPVSHRLDQPTLLARQYFDALLASLTDRHGGPVRFRIVPAGDVMAAVDQAIRGGTLPGLSSVDDLYRDVHHLGDAGRYLAGLSTILTLRRMHAGGLPIPSTYQQGYAGAPITPALAARLEQVANAVVPDWVVAAPGAPAVVLEGDMLRVTWSVPPGARRFVLYQGGAGGIAPDAAALQFANGGQATFGPVAPGGTYSFAVRALSSTDISARSATTIFTVPLPPADPPPAPPPPAEPPPTPPPPPEAPASGGGPVAPGEVMALVLLLLWRAYRAAHPAPAGQQRLTA